MMKGIEKYGIHATFTPVGLFEIVWKFTYSCNLKCKRCYENAGHYRPELTTDEAFATIDSLSKIANVDLPALSFSGESHLEEEIFRSCSLFKEKDTLH